MPGVGGGAVDGRILRFIDDGDAEQAGGFHAVTPEPPGGVEVGFEQVLQSRALRGVQRVVESRELLRLGVAEFVQRPLGAFIQRLRVLVHRAVVVVLDGFGPPPEIVKELL